MIVVDVVCRFLTNLNSFHHKKVVEKVAGYKLN